MGKTLTCCTQFWRLLFVILNIVFVMIGLTMVAVGIWLLASNQSFDFITDTIYASPAALLIIAGVITVGIALVGILGAAGMWCGVLIVYISTMSVVVILQIVAGILGAVFRDNLRDIAGDRVREAINDYRLNSSSGGFESDVNRFIDFIQEEFECCGFDEPSDWLNTTFFTESAMEFPESCECTDVECGKCAQFQIPCNASEPTIDSAQLIWIQGCDTSIIEELEDQIAVIAGVGTAFGLFQISGVAVALGLCICACMRRGKEDDLPIDDYVY